MGTFIRLKKGHLFLGHTIHLEAFGRNLVIPLKRNFNLLSPHAVLVDTSYDNVTGKVVQKRMSVIEDDDEYPSTIKICKHSTKYNFEFSY